MELSLKPDFDEAVERLEAWWHCEIIDRACIQFTGPRQSQQPVPHVSHSTVRERWFDVEFQVERAAAELAGRVYHGEAFPAYVPNLGPEVCATLYGTELEYSEGTSWSIPRDLDWEAVTAWRPDFENPYWRTLREMVSLSLERGAGHFLTGQIDMHTNADLLAALKDPADLCVDLIDCPGHVKAANDHLASFYPVTYDCFHNTIAEAGIGSTTWMRYYHSGRAYAVSCDFSALIGPEMFQEIFLPSILDEIRYLDRSCYHLDGPGTIPHLDALLAIPELNGIQWVYGAGSGPATRWLDLYRRIQDAGKCIEVAVGSPSEIEYLLDHLKPGGLRFCLGGSYSPEEAEAILAVVTRKSAGRR